ncbi:hypothetical protein, partial [Sodalis sp. dw_96]|uniref:hypothetical protein n=1 Tax=Sodalis sp. dw_96 TaxID=2719794 RepID=UPI001BD5BE6B
NSMKIVGGTNYLSFVKNADNSSVATFFDDGSYQIGNVYTYFNNDSTLDGINYIEADKNGNANYVLYDNGEILTTATSDITTPTGTNPLVYENSNNIYLIQNGSAITQLTNDSFANLNPVVIENGDGTFYIRFASQQKGSSFVAARMSGDAHNRMDDNKGILIHDFTTGQSLSVAGTTIAQAPITLSAQYPYDAFSFNGGPKYDQASSSISLSPDDMLYLVPIAENIGVDPSGESECSGASAKLYEKTGNTVLASATGASGFLLANISYGTLTFTDTCLTLQRGYEIAKSLGMKYQPIMTLIHGNQDASAGTSIATYKLEMQKLRTDYESYLQTLMSDSTFSLMCFVQQFSNAAAQAGATGATIAVTIAQAQYEVCRDNANFIMSSTQYARNYIDANHLKSKSYRTDGEVGGSVKAAWLNDGTILTLRPDETNIVQTDSTITIPLLGGVSPIVIDAGRVVDPGNYGFSATGSTISAVAISGSSIVITKSGTATDVSYAYYGSRAAAPGPQTGSRGCIRDSCPDVSPISGENLYNDLIVFIHTF